MAQSPQTYRDIGADDPYTRGWEALGAMISRGRSFSGHERNVAFLNTGAGRFADISAAAGLDLEDDARAVVATDWDHDGDLDLWFSNRTAPRLRFLRNDLARGANAFLALELEGTRCNRDALGARVEVHLAGAAPVVLLRTVRAGGGFLGQAGKALHFGLGAGAETREVVVRWPGNNEPERFEKVSPNGRYRLVQGAGNAIAAARSPGHRAVALAPSEPVLPPPTGGARIVFTRRPDPTDLSYASLDGGGAVVRRAAGTGGEALLVNLWASWCSPCIAELKALAAPSAVDQFQAGGLRVVALSTEAVEGDPREAMTKARSALDRVGWTMEAGLATPGLLRRLTRLHHRAIYREFPLPLPTSFLFDREGRLAVIYRGAVSPAQILADLTLLPEDERALEKAAFPFPGLGAKPLFRLGAIALARAYREAGYSGDAEAVLTREIERLGQPDKEGPARRQLAQVHWHLADLQEEGGDLAGAVASYQRALGWWPDSLPLQLSLGATRWKAGGRAAAEEHFARVLEAGAGSAPLLNQVAKVWQVLGEPERAAGLLRQAIELQPDDAEIRFNLALALETTGQTAAAIEAYGAVLAAHPASPEAGNNLAWILATDPDPALRDPGRALALAEKLVVATDRRSASALDTLAAAYAEAGRFDRAAEVAGEAIQLAVGSAEPEMAENIRARLNLYRQGRAYRAGKGD